MNPTPTRAPRWTPAEEDTLRRAYKNGWSLQEVMTELPDRSEKAIELKLVRMGLAEDRKRKPRVKVPGLKKGQVRLDLTVTYRNGDKVRVSGQRSELEAQALVELAAGGS